MSRQAAPERVISGTRRRPRRVGLDHLIVALAVAIAIPFTMPLCSAPVADVAIKFENPTEYPLDIEVNSDPDRGWMSAGFVAPRSTAVAHVVDHGDDWLFRFASQGEDGGELRLTRRELNASGWNVAIPVELSLGQKTGVVVPGHRGVDE